MDKINELKSILDYINENMRNKAYIELEFYRKELDKVIYNRHDGFQFVLITDELREKMYDFINEKKTLLGPMMDWLIGVYDKDAGIFITQIKQTLPGREVFEKIYKYIVFTDDGISFIVTVMSEVGKEDEDFYMIPQAYGEYEDKVKEGVLLYKQRLQYYFSLSKDITDTFDGIINKMHERVNGLC